MDGISCMTDYISINKTTKSPDLQISLHISFKGPIFDVVYESLRDGATNYTESHV